MSITTSWHYPDSENTMASGGTITWNTTGNANACDDIWDVSASIGFDAGVKSYMLYVYDFDFNLPAGIVVEGVEVLYKRRRRQDVYVDPPGEWYYRKLRTNEISLMDAGIPATIGTPGSDSDIWEEYPDDETVVVGASDDMWDAEAALTRAFINSEDFGVGIQGIGVVPCSGTYMHIDCIAIRVTYSFLESEFRAQVIV